VRQPVDTPDALLTSERFETKYMVDSDKAGVLVKELMARIPSHRFRGEGANPKSKAHHYTTTVYFDTPQRDLYRAAKASESNLKLRAREYYDLHPDLVETATDASQLFWSPEVLWLELKHREGSLTGKRRLGIPKRDVPGFFAQGIITPKMLRIQRRVFGEEAEQVLREVAQLCSRFSEPLRADCLVNYNRLPWQDDAGMLRVTLDRKLAFFSPREDLWQRDDMLRRMKLGTPRAEEQRCVLEVKAPGQHPSWLTTLLSEIGAEQRHYSKFEAASEAVHG